MTSVACARCGEEILGAVNRCWKCGSVLQPHSGPLEIPPVRRLPVRGSLHVSPDEPLLAAVLESPEENAGGPGGVASQMPPGQPPRRGSPFTPNWQAQAPQGAQGERLEMSRLSGTHRTGGAVERPGGSLANITTLVALGLAVFGGLISWHFPAGGLLLALGAVPFAVLGTRDKTNYRGVAVGALAIACGVMAWDLISVVFELSRRL